MSGHTYVAEDPRCIAAWPRKAICFFLYAAFLPMSLFELAFLRSVFASCGPASTCHRSRPRSGSRPSRRAFPSCQCREARGEKRLSRRRAGVGTAETGAARFEIPVRHRGRGERRGAIEGIIRDEGLTDVVSLPGWETAWGTPRAPLGRSHLSSTERDGSQRGPGGIPNVLKEAMATGMPVVATAHSGIRNWSSTASPDV